MYRLSVRSASASSCDSRVFGTRSIHIWAVTHSRDAVLHSLRKYAKVTHGTRESWVEFFLLGYFSGRKTCTGSEQNLAEQMGTRCDFSWSIGGAWTRA